MGGHQTFVGGIAYAENDSGRTDSFNETILVEVDQDGLYLKPMGMPLNFNDLSDDARLRVVY